MKKMNIFLATMLLLWGIVGCTNGEQSESREQTPPASEKQAPSSEGQTPPKKEQSPPKQEESEPKPSSERPAIKQDTILIEGMEEEFNFTLVEPEALGFSTYVIEDMIAEQKSSADGDALFVYTNFGGVKNQQAAIRVFSPKEEAQVELDELINSMKEQLTDIGLQMNETSLDSKHPFIAPDSGVTVKQVYALSSADLVGRAIFFEHDDHAYVLYYHYPPEYGDGFEPRANKLMKDIVWDK